MLFRDGAQGVSSSDDVSHGDRLGWDVDLLANLYSVGVRYAIVRGESRGGDAVFFGDCTKGFAFANGVTGRFAKPFSQTQQNQNPQNT